MCDHLCGSFHILLTSFMKLTINSVNWINSIMICREQNSEFCGILVILNLQIIHMWVLGTFITNLQIPIIYLSLWLWLLSLSVLGKLSSWIGQSRRDLEGKPLGQLFRQLGQLVQLGGQLWGQLLDRNLKGNHLDNSFCVSLSVRSLSRKSATWTNTDM